MSTTPPSTPGLAYLRSSYWKDTWIPIAIRTQPPSRYSDHGRLLIVYVPRTRLIHLRYQTTATRLWASADELYRRYPDLQVLHHREEIDYMHQTLQQVRILVEDGLLEPEGHARYQRYRLLRGVTLSQVQEEIDARLTDGVDVEQD